MLFGLSAGENKACVRLYVVVIIITCLFAIKFAQCHVLPNEMRPLHKSEMRVCTYGYPKAKLQHFINYGAYNSARTHNIIIKALSCKTLGALH